MLVATFSQRNKEDVEIALVYQPITVKLIIYLFLMNNCLWCVFCIKVAAFPAV